MYKRYVALLICTITLLFSSLSFADDTPPDAATPKVAYFELTPGITTNFYSQNKHLGYLQMNIDIMVANPADLKLISKNQPLIRDTIIEMIGAQTEATVKSLAGREQLRKLLVTKLNKELLPETGKKIVADLLFTKYLYQ